MIKNYSVVAIGTIILMLIGFYNGYPLVYSDSGTYIYSGFDLFVPNDRPIGYGLFVKFFSFSYTLWSVILAQNFITAYLIYELFKLFKKDNFEIKYLFTVLFLTICTGVGWYSNQIMADFFTPVFLLCIFLLVFGKSYSFLKFSLISIVLIFSSITHFSHLLIGLLVLIMFAFIAFFYKKKIDNLKLSISIKRMVCVSLVVLSGWIVLPTINFLVESKFNLSKGGHVFLLAHINDKGILKKVLKDNCDKEDFKDCKLCAYKDNLPASIGSFIWSGDFLTNTGGWVDSKEEYDKIIKLTLTEWDYLIENIYKSTLYGVVQMADNNVGEGLSAYNEGSAPYGQIHWRFNHELNNYLGSKQNKWGGVNLKFDLLTTVQWIVLIISFAIVIFLLYSPMRKTLSPLALAFLIFTIFVIFANSLVTAGLSAPYPRYQGRVVWLLPLAIIIIVVENFNLMKSYLLKK